MSGSDCLITIGIALLLAFVVAVAIVQPHFEASTFNKCTGGDATYWDAAFAELRVESCNS